MATGFAGSRRERIIVAMKAIALAVLLVVVAAATPLACARLNHPDPADSAAVTGTIAGEAEPTGTLRVATYNVHMESGAAIARAITGNPELASADVVLLQEIEAHDREGATRAQQVADVLGMSFAYAPGYGLRGGGSHGVAILSRYPLSDIEIIELPYFHVVVNSARRVALAATIAVQGKTIRVYSVHLDNRINPQKRKRQFAPVLAAARAFGGPVVIAGDLNTSPFCWAAHLLPIPCGLQDNAMESGARKSGMQSPVAGVGATSTWLSMKLDAIYTRGLVLQERGVESQVRLSDHLPLWVELALQTES